MPGPDIANAIRDARSYLTANPGEAKDRDSSATASVEDGLLVRVVGPDGATIATDMSTSLGGGGTAPSPGWLLRAANASCIATMIAMRAAEQGVTLDGLEVTVDSESNGFGILGIDDTVPAGPLRMRVRVQVRAADVPESRLRGIVDWGVAHCPVCDAVKRAVPVEVETRIG